MRNYCLVLLSVVLISFTSCEELANQTMPNDVVFFDLKKFIAEEVLRLNKLNPQVEKTTRVNDNTETKTLNLEDFQSELKIFQEADINKLAWIDKYTADSVFVGNQISSISYQAIDDKLTTRSLKINLINSKVAKVEIKTQASSIVTNVEKHLIYEPDIRYSILSKQKTTGSDVNEVAIEGAFLK